MVFLRSPDNSKQKKIADEKGPFTKGREGLGAGGN